MNGEASEEKFSIMGNTYDSGTDSDFAKTKINSNYSIPKLTKSVVNNTSSDGKNRTNDNLTYTITAKNESNSNFNSLWNDIKITDKIPEGLKLDLNSLKLNGNDIDNSKYYYNKDTQTLSINTGFSLSNGKDLTVTYSGTVQASAAVKTLTNTASVNGIDGKVFKTSPTEEAHASVNVPIENNNYKATLSQGVKNITKSDTTSHADSVKISSNDVLEFCFLYQVDTNFTPESNNLINSIFQDDLGKYLTLDPTSIGISSVDQQSTSTKNIPNTGDHKINIKIPYDNIKDKTVKITFKATYTGNEPDVISNQELVAGQAQNGSLNIRDNSNIVLLQPDQWLGFLTVPKNIDFGSITMYKSNPIKNNKTTPQENMSQTLVARNTTDNSKYQVMVDYSNSLKHR